MLPQQAHEAKRKLCGEYDLFLADERVLPQLPKLLGEFCAPWGCQSPLAACTCWFSDMDTEVCHHHAPPLQWHSIGLTLHCVRLPAGKTFFKKKKQPIPVNLATKDWGAQVRKRWLNCSLPHPVWEQPHMLISKRVMALVLVASDLNKFECVERSAIGPAGAEGVRRNIYVPRLGLQPQRQVPAAAHLLAARRCAVSVLYHCCFQCSAGGVTICMAAGIVITDQVS